MAAKANLIMTNDIQVKAREIDFVTRFERNWEHLRDILGIMRPIKKQPGAVLKSKYAEGTLQSGNVGEGEEIPYSKFTVKEKNYAEMTIEKYAKAVSIEAIKDHGYENAVQMTDDEFLFQLQTDVTGRFYDYLKTGTLTSTETTFQMALAMAKGRVENKFKQMHRNVTGVVGFVNILDVYEYLGAAEITIQNQFGFQYMKDFMGFNTIFLLSDSEIPRGQVIATPVENIVLYYVDPNESDFARAGLVYTVSGETNLIGFHTQGNYHTAVSEAFAVMGLTLFAEYIDAIAVITIDETPTLGTLTVASTAGSTTGNTKITVNPAKENVNNVYKYKVGASETAVTYGQNLRNWTTWDGKADVKATTGQKITVVECDGTYKALNAGSASVTAKS
ncbi:MAG: S-layer protein SbsC C-terminal domain [Bacteriophage sp.]|nr:MAG: S-layer protein SbsC C-terminal domain [Bacteriophage sp.]UVX99870.1 MAG: S-layer protein SbsC C-terminal domain [Bacteriophage sp.]UVY43393.1 MAG: S-layer protein SbsC C-terminal domain [Bacteriophage sp.]